MPGLLTKAEANGLITIKQNHGKDTEIGSILMGFKEENPGYPAKQYTTIANVCWPNRAIEFFWYIVFSFLLPPPLFFKFLSLSIFLLLFFLSFVCRFFKIYFYFFQKIFQFTFHFNLLFSILFLRKKLGLKNRWSAIKNCAHRRWRLRRMHNANI